MKTNDSPPDMTDQDIFELNMFGELPKEYKLPEDRYSRPCGGKGGFDDFVERWHE